MRIQRRVLDGTSWWTAIDDRDTPTAGWGSFEALAADQPPHATAALLQRLALCPPRAPVLPSKIVCVGLNYRAHALEMNKPLPEVPLLFLKPPSALLDPEAPIVLPPSSREIHHEGELAVVIGRRASSIAAEDAAAHVFGYTVMNDVTARDIQRIENKYTRAKGFDTFAPLGPTLVRGLDPDTLVVETRVNGATRQRSGCDDLIFSIPALIAFISEIMTLMPGDVISTGTPSGVGPIQDGDEVAITIEGIGTLRNPVVRRIAAG